MDQVRTVRLYGSLGAKFGRVHKVVAASAAQAMRALIQRRPGLGPWLVSSKERGEGYAVFYGKKNLREQDLEVLCSHEDDIRIAPIVIGAKNGGVFNIILGVVLVVVGTVATAFGYGAIGVPLVNMGYAMIIGGVVQLLTPIPKGRSSRDSPQDEASTFFNGPTNVQAQGNPVQLWYGEVIGGSAVISAGIDVEDGVYAPYNGPVSGGGGGGGDNEWHLEVK